MRNRLLILLCLLLCFVFLQSYSPEFKIDKAFQPGETLQYSLHYGWIRGGEATMTLRNVENAKNKMYYAKAVIKTVGITDQIYNVYDVFETFFDPETVLPYKSIRDVKEGDYKLRQEYRFKRKEKILVSSESGEHKVPEDVQDILSVVYYLRKGILNNIQKGDIISMNTFFDEKIYPLKIKYLGKEVINSEFGKIRCLKFLPLVETGRMFKEEDDMTIWFTDDGNYVPLRVQMDLFIGSVKCDLVKYSGLRNKIGE